MKPIPHTIPRVSGCVGFAGGFIALHGSRAGLLQTRTAETGDDPSTAADEDRRARRGDGKEVTGKDRTAPARNRCGTSRVEDQDEGEGRSRSSSARPTRNGGKSSPRRNTWSRGKRRPSRHSPASMRPAISAGRSCAFAVTPSSSTRRTSSIRERDGPASTGRRTPGPSHGRWITAHSSRGSR